MTYTNQQRYQHSRLSAEADRILKSARVCSPGGREVAGDKTFVVTTAWIQANATPAGGYKAEQLKLIGVRYPLISGWMGTAYGRAISIADKQKFEAFHTGYKATKKSKAVMQAPRQVEKDSSSFGQTQATGGVVDCGCTHVQPWEDCIHTDAMSAAAAAEMLA